MKKGKIGVQMMMLKGKVEELGAYEVFKRLKDMGYRSVEISQIPMTAENVEAMRKACEDFGIEVAACSASLEPMVPGQPGEFLTTDFDKIVQDCKTLKTRFLRIGMLPFTSMGSREKALDFVRRSDEIAERLAAHDIELYYHNHHIEFVKYDGEYLLDIIRDNTKYMGFELDVHWVHRGGANPIEVLRNYKDRVKLLHLKDYRIAEVKLPEDSSDRKAFFEAFTNVIEFAEVGEGNLPMKEIIEAGLESGSEYFIVEQDDQYGRDPFDCLQTSRDNLIKMGYEDWF